MAAKDRARGKAFERWVGARLRARRRRSGEGGMFARAIELDDIVEEDGSMLPFSVECKTYATLQLRESWIQQAKRNAGRRPWVIVQRPTGSRGVYVTMDFEFFLALLDLKPDEPTETV